MKNLKLTVTLSGIFSLHTMFSFFIPLASSETLSFTKESLKEPLVRSALLYGVGTCAVLKGMSYLKRKDVLLQDMVPSRHVLVAATGTYLYNNGADILSSSSISTAFGIVTEKLNPLMTPQMFNFFSPLKNVCGKIKLPFALTALGLYSASFYSVYKQRLESYRQLEPLVEKTNENFARLKTLEDKAIKSLDTLLARTEYQEGLQHCLQKIEISNGSMIYQPVNVRLSLNNKNSKCVPLQVTLNLVQRMQNSSAELQQSFNKLDQALATAIDIRQQTNDYLENCLEGQQIESLDATNNLNSLDSFYLKNSNLHNAVGVISEQRVHLS